MSKAWSLESGYLTTLYSCDDCQRRGVESLRRRALYTTQNGHMPHPEMRVSDWLRGSNSLTARSPTVAAVSHPCGKLSRRSSLVIDLFSFRPHATAEFCCHSLHLVAVLRLCLRTPVAFYCSPAISSVAALLLVLWRRLASASTPKLSPLRPTVFSVVAITTRSLARPYFHLRHY